MKPTRTRRALFAATAFCALAAPFGAAASTKNVLLFVSDGASWGTWDMTSYWQYGALGRQSYDDFDVKLGMTTEPYSDPQRVYDPEAAWDATPETTGTLRPNGGGQPFKGYSYIDSGSTDSAAAGTAISTGVKTRSGRVAYGPDDQPLSFITQDFKDAGKATGVVSSVGFTHATPAAFGAQNVSRNNYLEIGNQMINEGTLDLIMGAGHPFYDDNGELRSTPLHDDWFSEEDWNALNGPDAPMTMIDSKAEFEALADGSLVVNDRLIGIAPVANTLQYSRSYLGDDPSVASGWAQIETVPSLETMTVGALNHLGEDEDGMFVMIEGGAVDWAAHGNYTEWVIEEQVDFNNSVDAAVEWVETNSSWEETLMIVLTDHGNGMVMGPESDTVPFQAIPNMGAGVVPDVLWHTGSHTTENTLLWAHGAGSEYFMDQIVGDDPFLDSLLNFNDGSYIDITGVNPAIRSAAGLDVTAPVPLPAAGWLLIAGFGALVAVKKRRRAA